MKLPLAPRLTLLALMAVASCTPAQSKTADQVQDVVFKGKQFACTMGSLIVDPVELAKACDMADQVERVVPFLRELIGVRDAARRAGVVYHPPPAVSPAGDASTDASR